MNVLQENNLIEERNFSFFVNKYQYADNTDSSITIEAVVSQENFEIQNPLQIQFLFSTVKQPEPDFSDSKEYFLNDLLQDNNLSIKIPFVFTPTNLYLYVNVYTKFGGPATKFILVLEEEIVQGGEIFSNNFVDLRMFSQPKGDNTTEVINQVKINEDVKNQAQYYGFTFVSDVFYSLLPNTTISLLYGFDQQKYFLQNNYIEALNGYEKYERYILDNDFIKTSYGQIYDSKSILPVTVNRSPYDLENDLGTAFETNFKPDIKTINDELLSYNATFVLQDAQSRFVSEELLPQLKSEGEFISGLSGLTIVPSTQVETTISLIKQIYKNVNEEAFVIYETSNNVVVDQSFKTLFCNFNKQIYNLFQKNVVQKIQGKPSFTTITKDFKKIIDKNNLELATTFVELTQNDSAISSVDFEKFTSRREEEQLKYFSTGEINVEIQKQSGVETVNVNSLDSIHFSPESVSLYEKNILQNDKSVDFNFSNDDFLKYGQAINQIAAYNNSLILANDSFILDGVTAAEKKTETQSKSVTSILNSLKVLNLRDFRTKQEMFNSINSSNNSVKTFEIPSTLRTDLCVDNVSPQKSRETTEGELLETAGSFIGNNVLLFSIFNAAIGSNNKDFYEFYKNYVAREINLESLPIQALYLYKIYNERGSIPKFLDPEQIMRQFSSFCLIYFMFKNLVKVKIYLADQDGFVDLSEEILSTLDLDRDYLCRMELYEDSQLGIQTPNLFKTSIYNKHFVLTA